MKALAAITAGAIAVTAAILTLDTNAANAEGDATLQPLVEDFSHPGAATILTQQELKVLKGDGRIVFTARRPIEDQQCAAAEIQVERYLKDDASGGYLYCFKTIGSTGFLTLEIPGTFGIRGGSTAAQAKATLPTGTKTFPVQAGRPLPIDPGADPDLPTAVLVELRLAGT